MLDGIKLTAHGRREIRRAVKLLPADFALASVSIGNLRKSGRRDLKFEARNPNIEIRNNFKSMKEKKDTMFQTGGDRNRRFGFSQFEIYLAAVCFGFRYSNFGFISRKFVLIRGASFVLRISDFFA